MKPLLQEPGEAPDFRRMAKLALGVAGPLILAPFGVNNFLQGRYLLGVGSLAIVAILAFDGWAVTRGRDLSWLTLFGLVPAIIFFLSLALHRQGVIGVLWCYPAILSFYVLLPERRAWAANIVLLAVAVPQAWLVVEQDVAVRVAATYVAVSVFAAIFVRAIARQQRRLHEIAVTDPLTGLLNRKQLESTLEQAVAHSRRRGAPMTLIAFDLDRFKAINDSLGHDAGDGVLRGVADLVSRRMRRGDKVFRLGGEEFLVLLYDTEAVDGMRIAEELRGAIGSLDVIPGRRVSVSLGVATLRADEDWQEWMKRSDDNLYAAKAEGRDRTVA
jgi:diguanylate cyclase (GGDEF)-like protein